MPYTPTNTKKLSEHDFSQLRLALMGASKTGKTFSALSFPNPVVADFDNGLVAHRHREDVVCVPFYDKTWLTDTYPVATKGLKYPAAPALLAWLQVEGPKLQSDNTLVLDSWTTVQDAFDQDYDEHPNISKSSGKVDDYGKWDMKIDFSRNILSILKTLKCHIVVLFHEQDNRDVNGQVTGKIEPLMQGKFQKKLGLYFTDFYRTLARSKFDDKDKKKIIGTEYFWQTKSSDDCNLGGRFDLPMFVEPNYQTLLKAQTNNLSVK